MSLIGQAAERASLLLEIGCSTIEEMAMFNGKGCGMPKMIGLQEPGKFAGRYDQFEQWKDQLVKWKDLARAAIDNETQISQMMICCEKEQHGLDPYAAETMKNNCCSREVKK